MNQLIPDELATAAMGGVRRTDFSDVVGKWTPDLEFEEIIHSERQIDWLKWRL